MHKKHLCCNQNYKGKISNNKVGKLRNVKKIDNINLNLDLKKDSSSKIFNIKIKHAKIVVAINKFLK